MLKYFFKKLQKVPILREIKHFLFLLYYSINLHVINFLKHISKANKIQLKANKIQSHNGEQIKNLKKK